MLVILVSEPMVKAAGHPRGMEGLLRVQARARGKGGGALTA